MTDRDPRFHGLLTSQDTIHNRTVGPGAYYGK